jgi:glycosyltransferase involved in cell wall biosynthesis
MRVNTSSVVFLHFSCPPIVGGVEGMVRQQASLLHRHSWKVKVIAGKGADYANEYPVEINPLLRSRNEFVQVAQREVEVDSFSRSFLPLAYRIYEYLANALAGFDVLIAHNVLSMSYNLPLTMAVSLLAENDEIPVVGWNHDSPYFRPGYPDFLDEHPWTTLLKTRQPKIHYVTISESRREQFAELYGTAQGIRVIRNGIDPITFLRPDAVIGRLIEESNLRETDILILQPGRLHPRKNMELSFRVVRALKDLGMRAKLVIMAEHLT